MLTAANTGDNDAADKTIDGPAQPNALRAERSNGRDENLSQVRMGATFRGDISCS